MLYQSNHHKKWQVHFHHEAFGKRRCPCIIAFTINHRMKINDSMLPNQQLIGLLDKPRRNWPIKLIGDAHGLAAFMLHIIGSA